MKKLILLILAVWCIQAPGQTTIKSKIMNADTVFYLGGDEDNIIFNFWIWDNLHDMEKEWALDCCEFSKSSILRYPAFEWQTRTDQVVINYPAIKDCLEGKREEWIWDSSKSMTWNDTIASIKDVTIDTIMFDRNTLFTLKTFFQKYTEECYADSTRECDYIFISENGKALSDMRVGWGWEEYKCWWTHREPTLFGFTEFLEKILKQ